MSSSRGLPAQATVWKINPYLVTSAHSDKSGGVYKTVVFTDSAQSCKDKAGARQYIRHWGFTGSAHILDT